MQIYFSTSFDQDPWPGPLQEREAVVGEAWLGPNGFLDLLETQLGLSGPVDSEPIRAASLVPFVSTAKGFWSESAGADSFGVARELLRLRDMLVMHGWTRPPAAGRVAQFVDLMDACLPGVPDRLVAVRRALENQTPGIEQVFLCDQGVENLSVLWRQVIINLQERGTVVSRFQSQLANPRGDLAGCREPDFVPVGDSTLQLIRPAGPLSAAEQVAAWLNVQEDIEQTVVIGGDENLDAAFARVGLPALGSSAGIANDWSLQITPLVLNAAWSPQVPDGIVDLLNLRPGPVPSGLGRRLTRALQEWPATDSDVWRKAQAAWLLGIEDEGQRTKVLRRLDVILGEGAKGNDFPVAEVRKRLNTIISWLQGRLATAETDRDSWDAAVNHCAAIGRLVEVCELESFTAPQLQHIIGEAAACLRRTARFEPQAGIHGVRSPAAIAGSARRIVWWNFTARSADHIEPLAFSASEIKSLKDVGVELPSPLAEAAQLRSSWQKPLTHTTETLLLVCPNIGTDGEEEFPHPIWDEVVAMMSSSDRAKLIGTEIRDVPRKCKMLPLKIPSARTTWRISDAAPVPTPVSLSPTRLESLLACPFQWVVKTVGQLYAGPTGVLPTDALLAGRVGHRIIELVLRQYKEERGFTPHEAASRAGKLFDVECPRLAVEYFLPGAENKKADLRHKTVAAARELVRQIRNLGADIAGIEETVERDVLGIPLKGRLDLMLDKPRAVVDIKLGLSDRRDQLEAGTAIQLATYSFQVGGATAMPPVAFFIMNQQRLLSVSGDVFPDAEVVDGPAPNETWKGIELTLHQRQHELSERLVIAACDEAVQPPKATLDEDGLRLVPACHYCDFSGLCGKGLH